MLVRLKDATKQQIADWVQENLKDPYGESLRIWKSVAAAYLVLETDTSGNSSFTLPEEISKTGRSVTFKITIEDWVED